MKTIGLVISLFALLHLGTVTANEPAGKATVTKEQAAKAINKAARAYAKVEKLGYAWRDTLKKYIGPAKVAWKKGQYNKANQLAEQAMAQNNLAMQQYLKAQNARTSP